MSSRTHASVVIEPIQNGFLVHDPQSGNSWSAKTLAEAAGLISSNSPVVVAVPRRWVFLRVLRVPDVAKAEVRQVVGLQLEQMLPVSQNEVAFDLHLTNDVNSEGRLAVVFAVLETHLDELRLQLASAGLQPSQMLPACLGSALIAESEHLSRCLVVSPTGSGLAFDVVRDGEVVYSRETNVSSSDEAIGTEISQTLAAAEVEDIPILFTGGLQSQFASKTVEESATMYLGTPHAGRIGVHLESPKVAMAREAKKRASRNRIAVLLSLIAIVLWTGVYLQKRDANAKVASVKAKQEAELRTLRSKLSAAEAKVLSQRRVLETLERAFAPSQPLGDVLTVVTNHVGDGMWLTNFSVERGKVMAVRGTAISNDSVSYFVTSLSNDSRFRDVRLLFANNAMIDTTPVVQFSVQAHVVGNLPIADQVRASR